ncbi:hypothetical protein P4119_17645 [Pseudomonas aeruginosa]|nr:hypothetical protein [Pseudomonas aeruginosa]
MASNLEVVTQLMEYSRSGPLMQVMIFQALDQFSSGILASPERFLAQCHCSGRGLESLREGNPADPFPALAGAMTWSATTQRPAIHLGVC